LEGGFGYSLRLKVKWGYISAQKLEGEQSKVLLCPVNWKQTPSGVSLESPGLENIPHVPGNQAKVCQNHDVRKAVSASLSV